MAGFTRTVLTLLLVSVTAAYEFDYLTSTCISSRTLSKSHGLLSNSRLTYNDGMSCQYTVTTASPRYRVIAVFRIFDMEPQRHGSCVDYVNIYDGSTTGATLINSSPLCDVTSPGVVTSTGQSMTVEFVTDSSARFMGIDVILSEFYNGTGTCAGSEFTCTNGYCVDESLRCDRYEQCGDASDELTCTEEDFAESTDNAALIAGVTIGVAVVLIIGVGVGVHVYREYRWRKFLRDPMPAMQTWRMGDNYPVTQQYYKAGYKNMGFNSTSEPYKDFKPDEELSTHSSQEKITINVSDPKHSEA